MPRKRRQDVKINDSTSLQGLMQETYNDACLQINDAQYTINELAASIPHTDLGVEDLTKIAKEKAGLLKVKEAGIRIKLEIARLQSDILKNKSEPDQAVTPNAGTATLKDFNSIREMLKNGNKNNELESE